jgi:hypothetical protein
MLFCVCVFSSGYWTDASKSAGDRWGSVVQYALGLIDGLGVVSLEYRPLPSMCLVGFSWVTTGVPMSAARHAVGVFCLSVFVRGI